MMDLQQEPDPVSWRWVVRLTLATLATIVLSLVAAYFLVADEHGDAGHGTVSPEGAEVQPAEVGRVESSVYGTRAQGDEMYDAARARLAGYGWVDPARQRVHIPVDVAAELLLAGQGSAP